MSYLLGNKMAPLVSVLCPVYNAENFIGSTIQTILDQDYSNFEIVISDDCSTDDTVSILSELAGRFPEKIVLNINPTNMGITDNCNVALNLCKGNYIAFFAGDDLMYSGKIRAQVEAMEADLTSSMSYHSVEVLDGDNDNAVLFTTERGKQSYLSFIDIIGRAGVIGACSIMARANCIPAYGFSKQFPSVSDWLMHIDIALQGKIIKVDGVYAGYVRHKKGASRKTFETLGEIRGTLDTINERYNNAKGIVRVTRKAYVRYIVGELARLFISGDSQRLLLLEREYLKGMLGLRVVVMILFVLIRLGVNDNVLIKAIFKRLSLAIK